MFHVKHRRGIMKKINKKHTAIMSFIAVLIIVFVFFLVIINQKEKYYNTYALDNKEIGEVRHYTNENDDYIYSIYYPKTEYEKINEYIESFYKNEIESQKASDKQNILYMDYTIEEVAKQYISVDLMFTRYNEKDDEVYTKQQLITYDIDEKEIMNVEDVFRNNYEVLFEENNIIIDGKYDNFNIKESEIVFNIDEQFISLNYDSFIDYNELDNKELNPNAPEIDVINAMGEVDPNKPMIAITFDDGPTKENTLEIAKEIESYGGRATFFVIGQKVDGLKHVVEELHKNGHQIANHSWSHKNMTKSKPKVTEDEISKTQNAIFEAIGEEPTMLRPPYGVTNKEAKNIIENNRLQISNWTLDTNDWKSRDAKKVSKAILDNVEDGDVILCHDLYNSSIEGVRMALPKLHERGYQFVTLEVLQEYRGTNIYW